MPPPQPRLWADDGAKKGRVTVQSGGVARARPTGCREMAIAKVDDGPSLRNDVFEISDAHLRSKEAGGYTQGASAAAHLHNPVLPPPDLSHSSDSRFLLTVHSSPG